MRQMPRKGEDLPATPVYYSLVASAIISVSFIYLCLTQDFPTDRAAATAKLVVLAGVSILTGLTWPLLVFVALAILPFYLLTYLVM